MNIGIYAPHLDPRSGGGFSFPDTILKGLETTSTHHKFFVYYNGESNVSSSGITFITLPEKHKQKSHYFIPLLNKFNNSKNSFLNQSIAENHIDLIWFITPHYQSVDVPYIYTVWDLQHRLQPFFPEVSVSGWNWEEREKHYSLILPKAAYVLTGTQAGKKEIMDFYHIPEQRIKLLLHPTPQYSLLAKDKPGEAPKEKLPKKYLFYPAQFWPHKNHIGLLHSLKILNEKYKLDLSLVFTGSDQGNLSYVQDIMHKLKLDNNVFFLGFVTTDELIWLYKNAFALTYMTFFGPENLPPLEAFALGCPVVASDVSGAKEQLGDAALLVDPSDEEDIAEGINKLHNNQALRTELTRKGYKRAMKWTVEDYLAGVCKLADKFSVYRRCWK